MCVLPGVAGMSSISGARLRSPSIDQLGVGPHLRVHRLLRRVRMIDPRDELQHLALDRDHRQRILHRPSARRSDCRRDRVRDRRRRCRWCRSRIGNTSPTAGRDCADEDRRTRRPSSCRRGRRSTPRRRRAAILGHSKVRRRPAPSGVRSSHSQNANVQNVITIAIDCAGIPNIDATRIRSARRATIRSTADRRRDGARTSALRTIQHHASSGTLPARPSSAR